MNELELRQDLEINGILYPEGTIKTEITWCDITGALALIPLPASDNKYFKLN